MTGKKPSYDKFCWVCCAEDTNQNCWSCVRTFHIECTKDKIAKNKWLCPACVTIKAAAIADKQRGLELLPLIMKRVYDNPSYSILKSPNDDGSEKVVVQRSAVIVKEMDLSIIMENVAKYKNFEQFLADVEWMVHNCIILYTRLHLKTRTARVLLDHLITEIDIAKMCTDCYRNANVHEMGWFARVCRKPHLIVWTKRCDYNYWPAKVMAINGDEVMVQFFGNHTKTSVPAAASCFLYSADNPNHTNVTSYLYKSALKETNQYIENVSKKYGSYNLAANGTVFDPTMIDIDVYLADAIPDFDGFDQDSNDGVDFDTEQREIIIPTNKNDDHQGKYIEQSSGGAKAEKVGKIKVLSENVLQAPAKRIRLNDTHADEPVANARANGKIVIENENNKNIEVSSASMQSDKTNGMVSNSFDEIASNIAAELMKNFTLTEEILKDLVNRRLEKVLNDDKAKFEGRMDVMQHELDDAKLQLQQANDEKLELQQIALRKSQQLEKRDRQLAQAHLDYNDLMMELHNAKYLCDACGKNNRKNQ